MKVIEFFAGIGSFRQAMINQNIEHEVIAISEFDKYAINSYMSMYGQTENYGDINSIISVPKANIWTYGFPCQDISVAGKQGGIAEGTRSGLLLRFEQILETNINLGEEPEFLLMENVKNLVGKKHKADFDRWVNKLDELGYNSYWQVLNTKDYGLPQNRERVFCLSIKKELDKKGFDFPVKQELKLRLKDILENEVEEKYYLSNDQISRIKNSNFTQEKTRIQENDCCSTLLARDWKDPKCVKISLPAIARSIGRNPDNPSDRTAGSPTEQRLEINKKGVSNTLTSVQKDNYVLTPNRLGNIYGENKGTSFAGNVWDKETVSPTLTTMQGGNRQPMIINNLRIRKLTPKECWRLQGFTDKQFEKAQKVCSNTQLYKQAGNAISVNVLQAIFKKMIEFNYMKGAR